MSQLFPAEQLGRRVMEKLEVSGPLIRREGDPEREYGECHCYECKHEWEGSVIVNRIPGGVLKNAPQCPICGAKGVMR